MKTVFRALNQESYRLGELEKVGLMHFDQLIHPTQFLYGEPGVIARKKELLAMSLDQLRVFLLEKPIPYVLGPDQRYYIIDRHHLSLSLYQVREQLKEIHGASFDLSFKRVHFESTTDTSQMSIEEFSDFLNLHQMTYLKDGKVLRKFGELPNHIGELAPDFFRGLAWLVRKSGAYKKTSTPFAEFYWGEFFQEVLKDDKMDFSYETLEMAIRASITHPMASNLPGARASQDLGPEKIEKMVNKALKKLVKKGLISL